VLNIISKHYLSKNISGPQKVVYNLISGLKRINIPFVVNKPLDSCPFLLIQDDIDSIHKAINLPSSIRVIVGPNVFLLPKHLSEDINLSRFVYLQPSKWTKDFLSKLHFDQCPVVVWPVGIDLHHNKIDDRKRKIVLIYCKNDSAKELKKIREILDKRSIAYEIIVYGSYFQSEYEEKIKRSKYIIWLGRHESQGIALQEALAWDIPMIVREVPKNGFSYTTKKEAVLFTPKEREFLKIASVAPYFDERCGIKIYDIDKEFEEALIKMDKDYLLYNPREYIKDNLSLEKQAMELINIFKNEKLFNQEIEFLNKEKIYFSSPIGNNCMLWIVKDYTKLFLKSLKYVYNKIYQKIIA